MVPASGRKGQPAIDEEIGGWRCCDVIGFARANFGKHCVPVDQVLIAEHRLDSPVIKLSSPETREFWEVPVLFEDKQLLAINKPARLLTSPDRYDPNRPNLMKLLHRGIAEQKPWAKRRGLSYLANAHRLDFETT